MSLYDCHFDLLVRVEDPNGIELHDKMVDISVDITSMVLKKYPNSVVLPKGFKIVEDKQCQSL